MNAVAAAIAVASQAQPTVRAQRGVQRTPWRLNVAATAHASQQLAKHASLGDADAGHARLS